MKRPIIGTNLDRPPSRERPSENHNPGAGIGNYVSLADVLQAAG